MIVRFGPAFDGLRPRLPESPVDDVVLGPAGLLGVLETQLGLPPVLTRPGEALLAYRACLEEARRTGARRFYRRSLAVDSVNVARTLLGWREQWYEAGWDGTFTGDVPSRLADLAAIEQLAKDRVPLGRGQRLQRIAAARVDRPTRIERVELHDDLGDLPAAWTRMRGSRHKRYGGGRVTAELACTHIDGGHLIRKLFTRGSLHGRQCER